MSAIISYITEHHLEIFEIIGSIIVLARLIVKLTPTPRDDTILAKIVDFLGHVGLKI